MAARSRTSGWPLRNPLLPESVDTRLLRAFHDGDWKTFLGSVDHSIRRAPTLSLRYSLRVAKAVAQVMTATRAEDVSAPLEVAYEMLSPGNDNSISLQTAEALQWPCDGLLDRETWSNTIGKIWAKGLEALFARRPPLPASELSHELQKFLAACILHKDMATATRVILKLADPNSPTHKVFKFNVDPRLWHVFTRHFTSLWQGDPLPQIVAERTLALIEQKQDDADVFKRALWVVPFLHRVLAQNGNPKKVGLTTRDGFNGPHPAGTINCAPDVSRFLSLGKESWEAPEDRLKFAVEQLASVQDCWTFLENMAADAKSIATSESQASLESAREAVKTALNLPFKRNLLAQRNLELATLEMEAPETLARRPDLLQQYRDKYLQTDNCFEDLKPYLEALGAKLIPQQLEWADEHPPAQDPASGGDTLADKRVPEMFHQMLWLSRVRLLYYTSPHARPKDRVLADETFAMMAKLADLPQDQVEIYRDLTMAQMAQVAAQFLLRRKPGTRVSTATTHGLLQAMLLLEKQHEATPSHQPTVLMLVRLHLALGNVVRASKLWSRLAVKRATLNSLGPLFFDRISTIYPSLEGADIPLAEYFSQPHDSFSHRACMRAAEALQNGLLDHAAECMDFAERSGRAFARVMAVSEYNRISRFGVDKKISRVAVSTLDISDNYPIDTTLDLGSFPSWESSKAVPIDLLTALGPRPTSSRGHLALLGERFFDLIARRTVAKRDMEWFPERMGRISLRLHQHLRAAGSDLTRAERYFYGILHLVSALALRLAETRQADSVPATVVALIDGIADSIHALADLGTTCPAGSTSAEAFFFTLRSLHNFAFLRDALTATSQLVSAAALLAFDGKATKKTLGLGLNLAKIQLLVFMPKVEAVKQRLFEARKFIDSPGAVEELKDYAAKTMTDDQLRVVTPEALTRVLAGCRGGWQATLRVWSQVSWKDR